MTPDEMDEMVESMQREMFKAGFFSAIVHYRVDLITSEGEAHRACKAAWRKTHEEVSTHHER